MLVDWVFVVCGVCGIFNLTLWCIHMLPLFFHSFSLFFHIFVHYGKCSLYNIYNMIMIIIIIRVYRFVHACNCCVYVLHEIVLLFFYCYFYGCLSGRDSSIPILYTTFASIRLFSSTKLLISIDEGESDFNHRSKTHTRILRIFVCMKWKRQRRKKRKGHKLRVKRKKEGGIAARKTSANWFL